MFIEVSFLGSSLPMINIARVRVYGILLGSVMILRRFHKQSLGRKEFSCVQLPSMDHRFLLTPSETLLYATIDDSERIAVGRLIFRLTP